MDTSLTGSPRQRGYKVDHSCSSTATTGAPRDTPPNSALPATSTYLPYLKEPCERYPKLPLPTNYPSAHLYNSGFAFCRSCLWASVSSRLFPDSEGLQDRLFPDLANLMAASRTLHGPRSGTGTIARYSCDALQLKSFPVVVADFVTDQRSRRKHPLLDVTVRGGQGGVHGEFSVRSRGHGTRHASCRRGFLVQMGLPLVCRTSPRPCRSTLEPLTALTSRALSRLGPFGGLMHI